MSLATSGGGGLGTVGGGGGAVSGLAMAHQANNHVAVHHTAPPVESLAGAGATASGSGTASGIAIEVYDKTQKLSLSKAKNVAHLPITAVDLHAVQPMVALFPPVNPDDGEAGAPQFLGKMKAKLGFHANETSHKTLRKFLTKTKPYSALKADSLVTKLVDDHTTAAAATAASPEADVVVLDRPHLWLGTRRVEHVPEFIQAQFNIDNEASTAAIAAETSHMNCWWTNSTLDGSSPDPKKVDYDMDRVVCKLRLAPNKKALVILPEEATQLLLHQAQSHVAASNKSFAKLKEEVTEFPLSIAVPSWAMNDSAMEALYEAAAGGPDSDTNTPCVLFPRSACALLGSFIKPVPDPSQNKFLQRIATVQQALLQQHKLKHGGGKERFVGATLVITMGMTTEGVEATAILCTYPQNNVLPYQEYQVLANVSEMLQQSTDHHSPAQLLNNCLDQLQATLDLVAPDIDGPAALLTFGTTHEQDELSKVVQNYKKQNAWLSKVPWIAASVEAVSTGAALLGGIALGRWTDHEGKLAVTLKMSAAVATGIARYYTTQQAQDAQKPSKAATTPQLYNIKTIFDFDRRLPAGPYPIEFKASECVVHRERLLAPGVPSPYVEIEDDEFLKQAKDAESAKKIPEREKAALEFSVQVFQKYTRNGPWQPVGNPMAPLVKLETKIDEKTDQDLPEERIACEQVTWELSMAVTGTLASAWVGERESVVQAVKSARSKMLEWYGWAAFCVLFFGGFFVKSYWEDYVWKRDTTRLLDYYAHVVPNSTQDGDYDTASWLAYKYRHNKQKLWKNLENKYGVPVPDSWDGFDLATAIKKKTDDPEEVDLDESSRSRDSGSTAAGEQATTTTKTENDLAGTETKTKKPRAATSNRSGDTTSKEKEQETTANSNGDGGHQQRDEKEAADDGGSPIAKAEDTEQMEKSQKPVEDEDVSEAPDL